MCCFRNHSLLFLFGSRENLFLSDLRMAGIVAVFDFDKTIIDLDSDNWVVDELGFTDLFNQLLPTMPWNTLMVGLNSP